MFKQSGGQKAGILSTFLIISLTGLTLPGSMSYALAQTSATPGLHPHLLMPDNRFVTGTVQHIKSGIIY